MHPSRFHRRDFLALLGSLGATALAEAVPALALAETATPEGAGASDPWMTDFDAALLRHDWSLGWRTPAGDLKGVAKVEGKFPAAVTGVLYRNGPAGHDLGGLRYHHWFDGDGMIQRFEISQDAVLHTGRFVQTDKRIAEVGQGRRLVEAFGTKLPDRIAVTSPDTLNTANTSVLLLNDELLALWEGGSAVALDPVTLATRGVKTWRPDLKAMPFSAHPRVDRDGVVWNFGVGSTKDVLIVYKIGAKGDLQRAELVPVKDVPMIHDFAMTERHLVFLMPPLVIEAERLMTSSFLDAHRWRPELGMRVLVIDKDDFGRRSEFELPAGFLFHLGNAWEDDAGQIRVNYVRADQPDFIFGDARLVMRGRYQSTPATKLAVATLDLKSGRATQEILPIEAEFPRIDYRFNGKRYRDVFHITLALDGRPGFAAVAKTNIETGASERYEYGRSRLVEEHVFVADGSGPGWLIGTSLDVTSGLTVLSCFSAADLASGPVAVATLPYALPLGFHGNFQRT